MENYDPTTTHAFFSCAWRASALCGPNGGNCVEVNLGTPGLAGLRDSKRAAGSVLVFDGAEWDAFLGAARSGRFDRT